MQVLGPYDTYTTSTIHVCMTEYKENQVGPNSNSV
jgi:hypothetical protein